MNVWYNIFVMEKNGIIIEYRIISGSYDCVERQLNEIEKECDSIDIEQIEDHYDIDFDQSEHMMMVLKITKEFEKEKISFKTFNKER